MGWRDQKSNPFLALYSNNGNHRYVTCVYVCIEVYLHPHTTALLITSISSESDTREFFQIN